MKQPYFDVQVQNGRVQQATLDTIRTLLATLNGKRVRISIAEIKRQRSLNQNNFWWGVVVPILQEIFEEHGNECDPESVHHYAVEHIWNWTKVIVDPAGVRRKIVLSSTALDTAQWEDNITKTRAWCAQFGRQVPLPNEY